VAVRGAVDVALPAADEVAVRGCVVVALPVENPVAVGARAGVLDDHRPATIITASRVTNTAIATPAVILV
jgi:hypothetical protein